MAQIAFKASNYALNNKLSDLGFVVFNNSAAESLIDPVVSDAGGIKVFKSGNTFIANNTVIYSNDIAASTDIEILLLCKAPVSDTGATRVQLGGVARFNSPNFYGLVYDSRVTGSPLFTKVQMEGTATNSTFESVTTNNTIAGTSDASLGFGMRFQVSGNTIRGRYWRAVPASVESSEPGTWDFVATDSTLTGSGKVGIAFREGLGALIFTDLAIGTDGQSAVLNPPAQVVATPSTPVVSGETENSALVNWT